MACMCRQQNFDSDLLQELEYSLNIPSDTFGSPLEFQTGSPDAAQERRNLMRRIQSLRTQNVMILYADSFGGGRSTPFFLSRNSRATDNRQEWSHALISDAHLRSMIQQAFREKVRRLVRQSSERSVFILFWLYCAFPTRKMAHMQGAQARARERLREIIKEESKQSRGRLVGVPNRFSDMRMTVWNEIQSLIRRRGCR